MIEVYYDGNFWGNPPGNVPGKHIEMDEFFTWNGFDFFIPAIYKCKEGIVVDLCKRIPPLKIIDFHSKWNEKMEEDELSDAERTLLGQENPFNTTFSILGSINGQKPNCEMMSAIEWDPLNSDSCHNENSEPLVEQYHLDKDYGWTFCRTSIPWITGTEELLSSFSITLESDLTCHPYKDYIVTENECEPFDITIEHPVTGMIHTLHIAKVQAAQLSDKQHEALIQDVYTEYPRYFQNVYYKMTPPIDNNYMSLHDTVQSEPPKDINGQSCGASCIFLAGLSDDEEYDLALSSSHFEPVDTVTWQLDFFAKPNDSITWNLPII